MQRLFVISSEGLDYSPGSVALQRGQPYTPGIMIPAGATEQIVYTAHLRCRVHELRIPLKMLESFRLLSVRVGIEALTIEEELTHPEPETGLVHMGLSWSRGPYRRPVGQTMLEVGMDFTVDAHNLSGAGRQFYAEAWGMVGDGEHDSEMARIAWQGYAQQLEPSDVDDERIREAFSAGYQARRRLG